MQIWLPEVVANLADLEDEEVLRRERVVELVRVDLEQDRGHSNWSTANHLGSLRSRPNSRYASSKVGPGPIISTLHLVTY